MELGALEKLQLVVWPLAPAMAVGSCGKIESTSTFPPTAQRLPRRDVVPTRGCQVRARTADSTLALSLSVLLVAL